jgi:hypothetical protein
MQEGNKKKKWGKPKLIILTRGKPEEAVLEVCKTYNYSVPGSNHNQCEQNKRKCPHCWSRSAS